MIADYPSDLKYTKEHEWARIDGKVATIGITKFAVEQLGDITQVDLPKEGETVRRNDVFGTVESVKAVSDVYAPVSGTVVARNENLDGTPELVNTDPYGDGWLFEVKPTDPSAVEGLLDAQAYQQQL